jgi:serine/threonine protein phosphatase PrpC
MSEDAEAVKTLPSVNDNLLIKYAVGNTDKGCVRSANQDSYYIDPENRFFIVADGMGGHAGGEEASKIATDSIKDCFVSLWDEPISSEQLLEEAFCRANNAILEDQQNNPARADMGTTGVVIIFRDAGRPLSGNVGDSRLYHFRANNLTQISEDQTWVAQAVKKEALTPEQARVHPWRHVLSQCLGREDMGNVDILPVDVQSGDRLILCSDGLTEELTDEAIAQLLGATDTPENVVASLIKGAKDNGGRDNITVIMVEIN